MEISIKIRKLRGANECHPMPKPTKRRLIMPIAAVAPIIGGVLSAGLSAGIVAATGPKGPHELNEGRRKTLRDFASRLADEDAQVNVLLGIPEYGRNDASGRGLADQFAESCEYFLPL